MHKPTITPVEDDAASGGGSRPRLVWDLPVRVFHWTTVAAVALAAATGWWAPAWWLSLHVWAGYVIGLLLAFRLAWGFLGGRYSRFAAFPLAPAAVREHLKGLLRRDAAPHVGHNPAGSWMIVALIGLLAGLVVTGIVALGGQEDQGPLTAWVGFEAGHTARALHSLLAGLLMAAIAGHLTGVIVETRWLRHPVLRAMITGRKPAAAADAEPRGLFAWRGLAVFTVLAAGLLTAGFRAAQVPGHAWHPLVGDVAAYKAACSDCHWAFHPSLRSGAEWKAIMADLANHFGEDASVEPATAKKVLAFLEANDASTFDTKAANLIGRAAPEGGRITDTRFWKFMHHRLDPALFKSKAVGSADNCAACHTDAASGRFAAQAIAIPKGAHS